MTRPIPTDWQPPTELRCIGGPADGKWFAVPPLDYWRVETRGGAAWYYIQTIVPAQIMPNVTYAVPPYPRSALPGESV